jgi:hypothetical protein
MKNPTFILSLCLIFGISACDPGHRGKVVISNQSVEPLIFKYQTRYLDTLIVIKAKERIDVLTFGGLGEGRLYTKCLSEFRQISLEPVANVKRLKKDINDPANWEMVNKNKWRYSNKEILCVFRVGENDVQ